MFDDAINSEKERITEEPWRIASGSDGQDGGEGENLGKYAKGIIKYSVSYGESPEGIPAMDSPNI